MFLLLRYCFVCDYFRNVLDYFFFLYDYSIILYVISKLIFWFYLVYVRVFCSEFEYVYWKYINV